MFVIQTFKFGGSRTSLINLCNLLTSKGHDVEIFCFSKNNNQLTNNLNKNINIIYGSKLLEITTRKYYDFYKEGKYILGSLNFLYLVLSKLFGSQKVVDQLYKKDQIFIQNYLKDNNFNCLFSFEEGIPNYFSSKIDFPIKFAMIHTDYEVFKDSNKFEHAHDLYYKFNKVGFVSKHSQLVFDNIFNKTITTFNLKNVLNIHLNPITNQYYTIGQLEIIDNIKNYFTFISVGRFVEIKRFDWIIEISKFLIKNNQIFKWVILGDGPEYDRINSLIVKNNLDEIIYLFKSTMYPHSIIKECNSLIILSKHEAQPMVCNEALINQVPVVTTNYPSAQEVVKDNYNGMIVPSSIDALKEACLKLLTNNDYYLYLKNNCRNFKYDNNEIITNLIKTINESS